MAWRCSRATSTSPTFSWCCRRARSSASPSRYCSAAFCCWDGIPPASSSYRWYYLGGQNGIPSIAPMTLGGYEFSEGPPFYYLVLGILVVVYLLCRFLVRSQFGLALAGLRENEQRIAFFGYKAQHLKAIIFAIGGAVAGLAGSLYAFHEGFVWPNMVGVVVSTQVVLYVLFGGSGTLIGAVIGAVIVEGVSFWLSDNYREIWPIILGVLLLLVILFRPLGLISFVLGERERVGSFGAKPKENKKQTKKEKRDAAP
jgi:branched-chain amino acid transport system permease protein